MKENSIKDPLYQQIQREMNRVGRKVTIYNSVFYSIRILQIALAGTITVLSGWHNDSDGYSNIILALGAVITGITAFDTLFQVDSTRNTYKLVLFELRSIRTDIVFQTIQSNRVDGLDEKMQSKLFDRYRRAILFSRELIGSETDKNSHREPQPGTDTSVPAPTIS
ncbi:SLATT domain-containing protein [Neolewinella litorea]|uniref:SLATT domain-containing protein n=1 Tax=Neolewinella litorea TaxID=2562452 RepID=A0A4S4N6B0_9BACT|nr:SLATT domain-containing protein [Neolewinella litorea]THH34579.1 SLATT domain-containing protein [Neolewinella litorea]